MSKRFVVVPIAAAAITFGLFWVMQALIGVRGELRDAKPVSVVDFVRLKREIEPEQKKRERPDRTPPEQPPPPPQMDLSHELNPDDGAQIASMLDTALDLDAATDLGAGGSDRDVQPLVRVPAQYPPRAAQQGIEGWVVVRFTITKAGTVKDPVVVQSHPSSIFDGAALQAVLKWRYNPKIENGVAVERRGVQARVRFELEG